jgi:hypothetical protein
VSGPETAQDLLLNKQKGVCMRTENKKRISAGIPAVMMAFVFLLGSCGDAGSGRKLGAAIPEGQPVVRLADVLATPADYNGKMVVMKGIVSAQCPSLCEFTFKEGINTTLIFPEGFRLPKLKKGRPVTLYARITSGSENVVVTALGLRLEQEGKP